MNGPQSETSPDEALSSLLGAAFDVPPAPDPGRPRPTRQRRLLDASGAS